MSDDTTQVQKTTTWWDISLSLPTALVDDVSASLLELGALGVTEDTLYRPNDEVREHCDVTVLFDEGLNETEIREKIDVALLEFSLTPDQHYKDAKKVSDDSWKEGWKEHFKPIQIHESLWVTPPWHPLDKPGAQIIVIHPGMAFGTGQHQTTTLCLKAMSALDKRDGALFDVGCGSGILSISARQLGFSHVTAIDIDPPAVENTLENMALNTIDGIDVSTNPIEKVDKQFPTVVANIIAPILIEISKDLIRSVEKNGTLLLSGLLDEQRAEVEEAFSIAAAHQGRGLRQESSAQLGEWMALRYIVA